MTDHDKTKILNIDGTKYRTTSTKKFDERKKWKEPNIRKVTAVIPGTILKIYTNKGDEVKIGDKLLILEAMKMRNLVIAPIAGKIKKINVAEGQIVAKDFLLLDIE